MRSIHVQFKINSRLHPNASAITTGLLTQKDQPSSTAKPLSLSAYLRTVGPRAIDTEVLIARYPKDSRTVSGTKHEEILTPKLFSAQLQPNPMKADCSQ